ncbi:MAG: STAS domain-containing protein [Treponema sp.]|nr:STAS domain-containing protein [Treponema sp.]
MDQLTIKEKVGANYILLELNGAVNAYTISELSEKVYNYILDSNVVLDTSEVTQMDSSGVGVVIGGHNDGQGCGTKLFVLNPSDSVHRALDKTGFMDTFNIIHSVTEVSDA